MISVRTLLPTLLLLSSGWPAALVHGEEPLHVQVDRLIAAKFEGQTPAPRTDDAAFLRRVMLDLAGRIPTAEETRQFLADPAPKKRELLIDRLLAAPTYSTRMENLFHVMLMERRGDNPAWKTFLLTSFEQNRPWNEIARLILDPPAGDEQTSGSGFFITKRLETYGENVTDYSGLTRDVGRMFLGVDLQCAECHDHLFITEYKQVDFQGLYFVYKNLGIQSGKVPGVKQSVMVNKLDFVSVFDPTQMMTGPRVPFGQEIAIPPDLAQIASQQKNPKPDPSLLEAQFDPLALLAAKMTSSENDRFNRNIVNRLWFAMMGRGLVMPLDLSHSANPPSHPELLDLLAKEFVSHNSDIKWFLRELALTETYQRSSLLPDELPAPPAADRYLVALEKRLSAEQLLASVLVATSNAERLKSTSADGQPNADYTKLETSFRAAFANEVREPEIDVNATVKAALFLMNSNEAQALLEPQPGNLLQRLGEIQESRQVIEELYLSLFSRLPTEEEQADLTAYLEQNADRRAAAIRHVAWAMLSSMEFCVNH